MKKRLLILLIIVALSIPTVAMAYEKITYHTDNTGDQYYSTSFTVYNKSTDDAVFYSGYKLSDYTLTNCFGWYLNMLITNNLVWANPEYTIINGPQTVQMILTVHDEAISLDFNFDAAKKPKMAINGGFPQATYYCIVGDKPETISGDAKFFSDTFLVYGTTTFPNWDSSKVGVYEINWMFTPNDSEKYESKSGVLTCKFSPNSNITITPTPIPTSTPVPSVTPTPTSTPVPSVILKPTSTPVPSVAPTPTSTPVPSVTLKPTSTPVPSVTLKPTSTPVPSITPTPSATPSPTIKVTPVPTTTPTLTATSVLLDTATTYDINLTDKIDGASFLWRSSDSKIVKVNAKSGKVQAIKNGKVNITCKITYMDRTTTTLTCKVIVGYDEDAPLLTKTSLDLVTGDNYIIPVENKVAKSKYRWSSSDKSVVKVGSASGNVTAISKGEAYVTCTITTPDNQVFVIRCDISVIS